MRPHYLFRLLCLLVSLPSLKAADEYTFDLNKPPADARAQFKEAAANVAAHRAGPAAGFPSSRFGGFRDKLAPVGEMPANVWAAYRYAEQQIALAHLPNFTYLQTVRKTASRDNEMDELCRFWSQDWACESLPYVATHWELSIPSLDPRTPPEEVKKLHRYTVRLVAQMHRRLVETYDPDYEKHFSSEPPAGARGNGVLDMGPKIKPTAQEVEKANRELCEYKWGQHMIYMHEALFSSLRRLRSDLCGLFRVYLPGDKDAIREMLIEAGYKTADERKTFWEYCRTQGADWADWHPEDEQRLVTD